MDTIGPRRWYWEGSAESLQTEFSTVLGQLVARHPFDVGLKQRDAWMGQIENLKLLAAAIPQVHLFLEFSIPRMGKRADAVLIAGLFSCWNIRWGLVTIGGMPLIRP